MGKSKLLVIMLTFKNKRAYKRMPPSAFRSYGRQFPMHEMVGLSVEEWDRQSLENKIKKLQRYYLVLTKKKKLTSRQSKHMNAMKRWFNIQKHRRKDMKSDIENFFKRDVQRARKFKTAFSLRSHLILVAYQTPKLRSELLPLILDF